MKKLLKLSFIILCYACSGSDSQINFSEENPDLENPDNTPNWLIPIDQVFDGTGKDGIPSIDNPNFIQVNDSENQYLKNNDLVVGVQFENETRAYPHPILDWHEIVNDDVLDVSVAVTYCPLTGTALGWDRTINGEKTTFGVSGLLYNTNLIPYDRLTNSNWSQIGIQCVNGELEGQTPEIVNSVETTWGMWKTMFPNSKVLSKETGFSRTYGEYPYGDYKTNHSRLIFPVNREDNRLPKKERVHAIVSIENAKVYRLSDFNNGKIIKDTFKDENGAFNKVWVIGNEHFIKSFELEPWNEFLNFGFENNSDEGVISDNEGGKWNIFGKAISGPNKGKKLKPTKSMTGYWFSIVAFYEDVRIFEN